MENESFFCEENICQFFQQKNWEGSRLRCFSSVNSTNFADIEGKICEILDITIFFEKTLNGNN
jgi:hypothetical protein